MKTIRDTILLILGLALIAWSFYAFLQKPAPSRFQSANMPSEAEDGIVRTGDIEVSVEIADTDDERRLGLSGKSVLEEGSGMLFVFDEPATLGFWMKDMNFPIDIVWVDESWVVVGAHRWVTPESFPELFYSPSPVKYVLEIGAGEAERLGIDTGSELYFEYQK